MRMDGVTQRPGTSSFCGVTGGRPKSKNGGYDKPLVKPGLINNNFDLVDEPREAGGGKATIFVKSGHEYVRVATNVKKDDGSRAIGTILDPKGTVIVNIRDNKVDCTQPLQRTLFQHGRTMHWGQK